MTDGAIDGIREFHESVSQKSQEIKAKQNHGEIAVAMAQVMFQMVAVIFQGVMTLILMLPACATGADHLSNILVGDGKVGDEGRFETDLAGLLIADGHLAPVDAEGIVACAQR